MKRQAAKDLLYGGLLELVHNNRYYYNSSVSVDYNKFTEDGKEALQDFMKHMASVMLKSEEEDLNKRSKELVLKGLKGEKI